MKVNITNKLKEVVNIICERGQHCSCWFDGWFKKYWGDCCKEHDDDYILQRTKTKEIADYKFYNCLKSRAGKTMAWIMFTIVSNSKIAQSHWDRYKEKHNG
jgi:hypothetical protein